MKNRKVLVLTGPAGVGKTSIAKMLSRRQGFIYIDGDHLDTEFFPKGGQWFLRNIDKLKLAHKKILAQAKKDFANGKNNVVVDYIIFGDYLNFFKIFKKEFGPKLDFKVLFPSLEETVKRDRVRKCWTAGERRIRQVRKEFSKLKKQLGAKNFIDTTNQKPLETVGKYFI